jgi:excinuclease ABC subunit B
MAPNKTLAAQLTNEFKELFPDNAVEYFVSYYDYYQPEAYIPQTDTYIEKDSSMNEEIDRLRHSATLSLLTRRDVIVVASVSAIYGLGSPQEYRDQMLWLKRGESYDRDGVLRKLVDIHYDRNDLSFVRGKFRVRGDTLEVFPAYEERAMRWSSSATRSSGSWSWTRSPARSSASGTSCTCSRPPTTWPAPTGCAGPSPPSRPSWPSAWPSWRRGQAAGGPAAAHAHQLRPGDAARGRHLQRDRELLAARSTAAPPAAPPFTLLDYFPDDFVLFLDESHVTVPQLQGQYEGDHSRKVTLVEHGFRLPSAMDNRPLRFDEFWERVGQRVFVSATPGPYERRESGAVVEQIIRPTGLVDPEVIVRPTKGQIDDLIHEVRGRVERDQRVLVTTLTKKMAEDLTDYLLEMGLRVRYLHSEIDTVQRIEILRDLRLGEFDTLVGINLLREGLDLPEVTLVAILDADKEGFLRSETSLVQTIGRAARNVDGQVIMYADQVTPSMTRAIEETNRRRKLQIDWNAANGIDPQTIRKRVTDIIQALRGEEEGTAIGGRARKGRAPTPARGRAGRAAASRGQRHAPGRPGAPDRLPRGGDARGGQGPPLRVRRPHPRRGRRPAPRAAGHGRGGRGLDSRLFADGWRSSCAAGWSSPWWPWSCWPRPGGGAWWLLRPKARPDPVAAAYLEAWGTQDWPAMQARVAAPPADFAAQHTAMLEALRVTGASFAPGTATVDDDRAEVPFQARLALRALGQWSYQGVLRLVRRDGRWLVDWSPATLHPDLAAGQRFQRTRTWPERAPILAADGSELAGPGPTVTITVVGERVKDRPRWWTRWSPRPRCPGRWPARPWPTPSAGPTRPSRWPPCPRPTTTRSGTSSIPCPGCRSSRRWAASTTARPRPGPCWARSGR